MTAAVLLCAGGSSRFAGEVHKLLVEFRGRPLVTWAVEHALAAGLDETIVVTGAIDLTGVLGDQVRIVHNDRWASGQALSLQAGVACAAEEGHRAVVVGLGDQPLIPPSAWSAVAASTSPVAVANFAGHRTPPVRLDSAVWSLLPTEGDRGARDLISSRPDLVGDVPCEGESVDIDTMEELNRWN
jgi:CTP:molybdopterin cytidylyltransferase MocA